MPSGIAPGLLLEQVKNTAAWALDSTFAASQQGAAGGWRTMLASVADMGERWSETEGRNAYLGVLLAAHYTTVATFVPTDVDNRIRYHAWQELRDREQLEGALRVVDETDWWDASFVSARTLRAGQQGLISGHDGEWMAVRAGALGRALALKLDDVSDAIAARIEGELAREAAVMQYVVKQPGLEMEALRASTILAHNAGDLSRVVEDWPVRSAAAKHWVNKFASLGHEKAERFDGMFVRAGNINKAVMAMENHRFLPLRKPRVLRRSRDYLQPIGPFFDAWGERLARHPEMDADGLAEVLAGLLEGHSDEPSQLGYVRAMAGIHRGLAGGIEALAQGVPARLRKLIQTAPVRDAIRVEIDRFEARLLNRYKAARSSTG